MKSEKYVFWVCQEKCVVFLLTYTLYFTLSQYIINAFDYELSNGIVEGTNNNIKQLKHNACDYRKFSHLKARVILIKGIYNSFTS